MRVFRKSAILGLVAVLCATLLTVLPAPSDESAEAASFDPGFIISDALFFNPNTMTEAQVQSFLVSKVSSCGAGSSCLRNYKQNTAARAATPYCAAYPAGTNESAARIIKKVAQACGINPQVLIVTLQKEQGLITTANPSSFQMRAAMGYGCPDTAPCDAQFYGFFNQVYQGAMAFKRYAANPQNYRYKAGANNAVLYHPNAACGSSTVFIRNQATAGLYVYTPYQPNAAALAAGFGTGNSCSSYGNRNFYNYFTQWFGSPNGSNKIEGRFEAAVGKDGALALSGWVFEEGNKASLTVRVTVNGKNYATREAASPRADVQRAYPLQSGTHGIALTLPAAAGSSKVCLVATASGNRTLNLGCKTATVTSSAATLTGKSFSVAGVPGGIKAEGFVFTGKAGTGGSMHFYINGKYTAAYKANRASSTVAQLFPSANKNIGYSEVLTRAPGTYNVCVYAVNAAGSAKVALHCGNVTVESQKAVGKVDSVTVKKDTVTVSGWAFDPGNKGSVGIRVMLNGALALEGTANQSRPDVARVYPQQGTNHGYQFSVPGLKNGKNTVCIVALNMQKDKTADLGCKTVSATVVTPVGRFETATATGSTVSVTGWAFDPTSTTPSNVFVRIDGVGRGQITANLPRADVQRTYPKQGPKHGFSYSEALSVGSHSVCLTALTLGGSGKTELGCRTVTVNKAQLDGRFESATVSGANVAVAGWAFETGLTAPTTVEVTVNGKVASSALTTVSRPDVQRVYPRQGGTHGYQVSVPVNAGANTVCTTVYNVDKTQKVQLGCKTVTR